MKILSPLYQRRMPVTLRDLLVHYESRKGILQQLSAWDVAKLDLCLGQILNEQERIGDASCSSTMYIIYENTWSST